MDLITLTLYSDMLSECWRLHIHGTSCQVLDTLTTVITANAWTLQWIRVFSHVFTVTECCTTQACYKTKINSRTQNQSQNEKTSPANTRLNQTAQMKEISYSLVYLDVLKWETRRMAPPPCGVQITQVKSNHIHIKLNKFTCFYSSIACY